MVLSNHRLLSRNKLATFLLRRVDVARAFENVSIKLQFLDGEVRHTYSSNTTMLRTGEKKPSVTGSDRGVMLISLVLFKLL